MRIASFGAGLAAAVVLTGCLTSRFPFIYNASRHDGREVVTPRMAEASVEAAKRVDKVGRQLLAGNPSLGMEVTFQTVGFAEPEVFHKDPFGLFITEGLVNLCDTDDKLAAVLATELGHMAAEARHRGRMQIPDPIPTAARGPKLDGVTDYDPARDMELAMFDRQRRTPADGGKHPTADPRAITEGILKEAKVEPQSLAAVAPLLKEAKRNHTLAKQFGGAPNEPHWTR